MGKAAIAQLNAKERKDFIDSIKEVVFSADQRSILIEALEIMDQLLLKLAAGNLSIKELKTLFGMELAKLKKQKGMD